MARIEVRQRAHVRNPRIGDDDVHAAEDGAGAIESRGDGRLVGDVHLHRGAGAAAGDARNLAARPFEGLVVNVGEDDVRARSCQLHARGHADGAGCSGDEGDLARKRFLHLLAQLRLLETPVLHVEQLGVAERLVAADRFRRRLDAQRVLRDVRGDGGVLARLARIDLAARDALRADLLREVGVVLRTEACDGVGELPAQCIGVVQGWLRDE